MFYSVELLNRRGSKFGFIWQVANNKNLLSRKGSKTDRNRVDSVNLSISCAEVAKFLSEQVSLDRHSLRKKRLSLYLSAMLIHGIAETHNQQVKLQFAQVHLTYTRQAAEKERRERNPNHEILDLSNVSHHLLDPSSLEGSLADIEFGVLNDVSSALSRSSGGSGSSGGSSSSGTSGSPPGAMNELDDQLLADRGMHDPDENLEDAFQQMGRPGRKSHIVEPKDITLPDVEPINHPMLDLQKELLSDDDLRFGPFPEGGFLDLLTAPFEPLDIPVEEANQAVAEPLPVNQEADQTERPREPNDRPAKRPRTDIDSDVQQQPDPRQMQIELEPVDVRPRNRRRRRLIVDVEKTLPANQMKDQLSDTSDIRILVKPSDAFLHPKPVKAVKAGDLLVRPSMRHLSELPRNQVTRYMITRPATQDEGGPVPEERGNREGPQGGEPTNELEFLQPTQERELPMEIDEPVVRPANVEHMDVDEPQVPGSGTPSEPSIPSNIVDTMHSDVETLRHQSGEASYSGSLSVNTSRIDVSSSERSPVRGIETERLPRLDEASYEASTIHSRLTGTHSIDVTGRSSRQTVGSLALGDAPDEPRRITRRPSRRKKSGLPDVPEGAEGHATHPPEVDGEIPSATSTKSTDCPVDSDELLARIENRLLQGPLTFRILVPPATSDRTTAATTFVCLLGLAKDGKVNLAQNHTLQVPYPDILITLRN